MNIFWKMWLLGTVIILTGLVLNDIEGSRLGPMIMVFLVVEIACMALGLVWGDFERKQRKVGSEV